MNQDSNSQGIPPAQPVGPQKTSTLAIVAFALSLIPCINIIGLILGIVALVKLSEPKNVEKGRGWAIAAIVIVAAWFVISILAAIAIPNFIKFQARSKQSEAKSMLRSIQTAQRTLQMDNGTFAPTFSEVGISKDDPSRYTYYMGNDKLSATKGPVESLPSEVETYVSKEHFRVVAVGNIDQDETLDVWVITEKGDPENIVNDVRD